MFKKYLNDLERWLMDGKRKPLMVWGARQVGKTTLLKDIFAAKYFPNQTIYVDCRTEHNLVDYCF